MQVTWENPWPSAALAPYHHPPPRIRWRGAAGNPCAPSRMAAVRLSLVRSQVYRAGRALVDLGGTTAEWCGATTTSRLRAVNVRSGDGIDGYESPPLSCDFSPSGDGFIGSRQREPQVLDLSLIWCHYICPDLRGLA